MTEEKNDGGPEATKIREYLKLGPFGADVFVSFRYRGNYRDKVENLRRYLESKEVTVKSLLGAQGDLRERQKQAIREARFIVVLLESEGMHNGPKWGEQYNEIRNIIELWDEIYEHYPKTSGADPAKIAGPHVVICPFVTTENGAESWNRDDFINRIVPSREMLENDKIDSEMPSATTKVRDLFFQVAAWIHPARPSDANDSEPKWHRDILEWMADKCRDTGKRLASGSIPTQSATVSAKSVAPSAVSVFDPVASVNQFWQSWERGRPGPWHVSSLEIEFESRIWLPARIEFPGVTMTAPETAENAHAKIAESRESLWVNGERGAGKTSLLAHAAFQEAELFLRYDEANRIVRAEGETPRLPLLFSLKRLREAWKQAPRNGRHASPLVAAMAKELNDANVDCTPADLRAFLREQRASIYFDGFEDLSEADQNDFLQWLEVERKRWEEIESRIVVSCRKGHERRLDITSLTLLPLDVSAFDQLIEREQRRYGLDVRQSPRIEKFASNLTAVRRAFESEDAGDDALRTPLMLNLMDKWLSSEFYNNRRASGSGRMICVQILTDLFSTIAAQDEQVWSKSYTAIDAFSQLARDKLANREITEEVLYEALGPDLSEGVPINEADARRTQRKRSLTPDGLVLRQSSERYEFSHDIFPEYLFAASIAREWRKWFDAQDASQRVDPARLIEFFGGPDQFEKSIDLLDLVPCIFFDHVTFVDLDESRAVKLAIGFCMLLADWVDATSVEEQVTRRQSARVFLEIMQALQAIKSTATNSRPLQKQLDAAIERLRGLVHNKQTDLDVRDRENLISVIAAMDEALWKSVTGAHEAPVRIEGGRLRPDAGAQVEPVEIQTRTLLVQRKPVLVREYLQFCNDPNRYHHNFWPMRTGEERSRADTLLIVPLGRGQRHDFDPAIKSAHRIIGDVSEKNPNDIRRHWREQQRFPARPVTNISWTEAVAFARWKSEQDNKHYQLPGLVEWMQIRAAQAAATSASHPSREVNTRSAQLFCPSTIGTFSPDGLGLFDFGSNVSIWLADYAWTTNRPWPPVSTPQEAHFIGPSYEFDTARQSVFSSRAREAPAKRRPRVGMWLIEIL